MKTYVPHYYSAFKCKAGECRHTCCEHWEIDIDSVTLEKYNNLNSTFGKKILENIEISEDCSSFKLCENERCPFLNETNLCDIILNLGEDYICDICADHPRYRNFYSDRIEMGLGLCCEEVCRIILSDEKPFDLIPFDGETEILSREETDFINERSEIIKTIESFSDVFTAIGKINSAYNLSSPSFDAAEYADFFMGLEMLDVLWKEKLLMLKRPEISVADSSVHKKFLNLYKYFIFRHLTEGNVFEALVFSEISVKMIWSICERTDFSFENICEIARMYSAETEYSDENTDEIINYVLYRGQDD